MQIDAMYDSGTVILPSIRLKHSRFQVQVIIPDDVIIDATRDSLAQGTPLGTVFVGGHSIVAEVQEILGSSREKLRNMPLLTKQEMREIRCDEWEGKHLGST
jgi:hypothetical protein